MLVDDDGAPVLAAVMTPPFNPVLSMSWSKPAVDALIDGLGAHYPALPGVTAPSEPAAYFARQWSARTRQPARIAMDGRLYKLMGVEPPPPTAGTMRPIAEPDHDLLIDWVIAFEAEAFPQSPRERDRVAREVQNALAAGVRRYFVWEDGGRVVSLVGCSGDTPNGARVGPVYTPPALRGRGYASACVAAVTQRLLDEGKQFVTLFTDLANPTANHIYQRIGYRPLVDFTMYRFDPSPQ
jgi:predicted GNAT family acetyltransferase